MDLSALFQHFCRVAEGDAALSEQPPSCATVWACCLESAVADTQIATTATVDPHTLQECRAAVGAQWTFLSDPERKVQQDLDIQEYTDPEHNPMIPHTLVLKPGVVIDSIYNGYW